MVKRLLGFASGVLLLALTSASMTAQQPTSSVDTATITSEVKATIDKYYRLLSEQHMKALPEEIYLIPWVVIGVKGPEADLTKEAAKARFDASLPDPGSWDPRLPILQVYFSTPARCPMASRTALGRYGRSSGRCILLGFPEPVSHDDSDKAVEVADVVITTSAASDQPTDLVVSFAESTLDYIFPVHVPPADLLDLHLKTYPRPCIPQQRVPDPPRTLHQPASSNRLRPSEQSGEARTALLVRDPPAMQP
ncbi:MAG: hypothetical protein ABR606_12265 [Vicinamibacterales bacterium]